MNVSMAYKIGTAIRVVKNHAARNRTINAIFKAGRATAGHFGHILRQLWLEVTGFVFLALSSIGALALIREWTKYEAGKAPMSRVIFAICFTAMFGWFGVSSFWRVRKKTSPAQKELLQKR